MLWLKLCTQGCLTGKTSDMCFVKMYFGAIDYSILIFLFANLCCRIVDKINSSIGQDPNSKSIIGVLDIYGFESFKTNRCLTGMPCSSNWGGGYF